MRLVEERTSIVVQLIMLLFIVLSGIAIQYCYSRIADHNNWILTKALHVNRIESERISQKLSSVRYLVAAYANATVNLDESRSSHGIDSSEFMPILEDFKSGRIDDKEYANRMSVAHNRRGNQIARKYENELTKLGQRIDKGTKWTFVKQALVVIQILAIFVAAVMYSQMLSSIRERTRKKNS